MELFGEKIAEPRVREPKTLAQYNEQLHVEAIKDNALDLYENEYHLIEQSLNLPPKFMELSEIEQRMVLLFVDKDFVEPNSKQKTQNNAFISFLASYHNQSVIRKLYKTEVTTNGYDKFGNELTEEKRVIDPQQLPLYIKLKTHSAMLWKTNNLKEISKAMLEIMTNDGFRDNEILERKIMADALSEERDSFTMQNRRLAVDIKGMKKPQGLQQINVYLDGGGQKSNDVIVSTTGNEAYDLIPDIEEVNE